jgi:putative ABC transport system substrate-binding protein
MPVVGFLGVVSGPEAIPDLLAAFRRGLAEADFVEGKNLVVEYRFANFRPELMLEGARDKCECHFRRNPRGGFRCQGRHDEHSYC